jgi:hypothetical protein
VITPALFGAVAADRHLRRLLAAGSVQEAAGSQTTVTGSVVCDSGRPAVGVWIAASSGQKDSGYAHLGPPSNAAINYPAGTIVTYQLPAAARRHLLGACRVRWHRQAVGL